MPTFTNETDTQHDYGNETKLTTLETAVSQDKDIKARISALLDVKSMLTLIFAIGFLVMSFSDSVPSSYDELFRMIVVFYFGRQSVK